MAKKKMAKKAAKKAPKKAMKRTAAKKVAAKVAAPKKIGTVKEAFNKTAILSHLAEQAGVSRGHVKTVMESLVELIEKHVKGSGAAGEFTLPGLLKIRVVRKPATKARKGINPFTGEEIMFKAKPARNVVKIKALKKLKEMVA